jgi:ribonuclease HII
MKKQISSKVEIGVDESGRGPLFGRVYTAAVVLPKIEEKDSEFHPEWIKDSKRFHSRKKIKKVAEHIKEHAICYSVTFEEAETIDEINILQANMKSMHSCIKEVAKRMVEKGEYDLESMRIMVDGNYFVPLVDDYPIDYTCIPGGDDEYLSIAAASILAKVSRDEYIDALCQEHPYLDERYGIASNKGYGTQKHIKGIQEYGITPWHRKTFRKVI